MRDVAMVIGYDLYFDMLWLLYKFFEENSGIAKRFQGFVTGFKKSFLQFFVRADHAHTTTATARSSFQHDRITDAVGFDFSRFEIYQILLITLYNWNVAFSGYFFGGNFIAE